MIEDYEATGRGRAGFLPYGADLAAQACAGAEGQARPRARPADAAVGRQFRARHADQVPLHLGMLDTVPTGELHAAIADHYASIAGGMVEVKPYTPSSAAARSSRRPTTAPTG